MALGIIGKALAVWLGILVLAVANGALRETVLIPKLGEPPGFVLSGIVLSALILAVAYISLPWFGHLPKARYFAVGMGWLVLTVAFEFIFGRLIQCKSWSQILEAYAFKDGNIWPLVLVATAMAPYVAAKIREWV